MNSHQGAKNRAAKKNSAALPLSEKLKQFNSFNIDSSLRSERLDCLLLF